MSTFASSETYPGWMPRLTPSTHCLLPTEPEDPMETVPFGPVETCPLTSAVPTATEFTRPELLTTSPLSPDFPASYFPLVLLVASAESKLSVVRLLPLRLTPSIPTMPPASVGR